MQQDVLLHGFVNVRLSNIDRQHGSIFQADKINLIQIDGGVSRFANGAAVEVADPHVLAAFVSNQKVLKLQPAEALRK